MTNRTRRRKILAAARRLIAAMDKAEEAKKRFVEGMWDAIEDTTQTALGREIGFSPQHICDVLNGRRGVSRDIAAQFLIWAERQYGKKTPEPPAIP